MNNQKPNQMTEYYIAYFDILGYQELFKETPEKVQDFLNTIHSAITKTKSSVKTSYVLIYGCRRYPIILYFPKNS